MEHEPSKQMEYQKKKPGVKLLRCEDRYLIGELDELLCQSFRNLRAQD